MTRAYAAACCQVLCIALWATGCPEDDNGTGGGGITDAGADASEVLPDASLPDASLPDAAPPMADAAMADATVPDAGDLPDAGPATDAGPPDPGCCEPGTACEWMLPGCVLGDLTLSIGDPAAAVTFRNASVSEDDCQLYEGCLTGSGARSLMELSFSITNAGPGLIDLGKPFESELFHASLCQDAYVIDGFFVAELRTGDGALVAEAELTTACVASAPGFYDCTAQGLGPGETSAQPAGSCDFIDITGLPGGDYTLRITVNPSQVVAESDFTNNSDEVALHYEPCSGTVCGGSCCPAGAACVDSVCMLPDLRLNAEAAEQSLMITHQTFGEDSCELEEMCVTGGGRRRLLQFEGRVENLGPGDLNPGSERNNPLFEYSACHEHYHFVDFTDYRLLAPDGSVAAFGHKQSFCLIDMEPVEGALVPAPPGTHPEPGLTGCNYLSAGWADIYSIGTPCQWIDITDVPEGDYVLALSVNPAGRITEAATDNNTVEVQVHIPADVPCDPEPEICDDAIDQDCDDLPDYWDPDCNSGCYPDDPFCEVVIPVAGNTECANAHEMTAAATYRSPVDGGDPAETAPSCGGSGGEVFFGFTLETEQVVYLGTLGSEIDTVLALYRDGCGGSELRCADDDCAEFNGHFADVLPAGSYVVSVKAKYAEDFGAVQLKFQRAEVGPVTVLHAPGVYAGDTTDATNDLLACEDIFGGPGPTPDDDAGIPLPPISGRGGMSVPGPAPGRGPRPPVVGTGGTFGGGPGVDGGVFWPIGLGPEDVYALAACTGSLTATTCGTAEFDSMIEIRTDSLAGPLRTCTALSNGCHADPRGAAGGAFVAAGLAFVIVDGSSETDRGEYQLSVTY